jgi:hypothetical protein
MSRVEVSAELAISDTEAIAGVSQDPTVVQPERLGRGAAPPLALRTVIVLRLIECG